MRLRWVPTLGAGGSGGGVPQEGVAKNFNCFPALDHRNVRKKKKADRRKGRETIVYLRIKGKLTKNFNA